MKRRVSLLLFVTVLACISSAALADDAFINWTFASWDQQTADHVDGDPWKGVATVTVLNSSNQPWGDFHFSIGYGPGVKITAAQTPTASLPTYAWNIPNDTSLDFTFYSNPVLPTQSVTFTFYTDNTANKNALFGLCAYPTPVPEPSSLLALSAGAFGLVGFVARKRR